MCVILAHFSQEWDQIVTVYHIYFDDNPSKN